MLASESDEYKDMIRACQQIITNCTDGEVLGDDMTIFDMQDLFIRIRSASIGETQEFQLVCGECEKQTAYELELKELTAKGLDNLPDKEIKVGDEFVVVMKYPNAEDVIEGFEADDVELISTCIDAVVTQDETLSIDDITKEEVVEFIENLPLDVMDKMREFIQAMPVVEHIIDYKCHHCDTEQKVSINGYEHFFG